MNFEKLKNSSTVQQRAKYRKKIIDYVKPIVINFPKNKLTSSEFKILLDWYNADSAYFITDKFPEGTSDDEKVLNVLYFFVRNKFQKTSEFIDNLNYILPDMHNDPAGQIYRIMTGTIPDYCSCNSGNRLRYKNYVNGFNKSCSKYCSHTTVVRSKTNMERYGKESVFQVDEIKDRYKENYMKKHGVSNPMHNEEVKNKLKENYMEKTGFSSPLSNPEVIKKISETNNLKYGGNSPMCSDKVKEKTAKTNIVRYGKDNVSKVDSVKEKTAKTNIKRYGGHSSTDEHVKEKTAKTNIERYGNKCSLYGEHVKEKTAKTNIERYGYKNPIQNNSIRQKASDTYKEKTGYENPMKNPDVIDEIKKKTLEEFGVSHFSQKKLGENTYKKINDKVWLQDELKIKSVVEISSEFGCCETTIYKKCKLFGINFDGSRSSLENVLSNFLSNVNMDFVTNTRKIISPLELDFYIPEYNLAIELNGIYWHSDIFKDKNYHLNKYNLCKEKGIRLISINEDEWNEKSDIIKSKILYILGKSKKGLPARKLSVREITSKEGNDFCELYHIQGSASAIIYSVGAFDNNDLVGVMLFSKQRTTGDIELIRFCHDGDVHNGLFSKMLKFSLSAQKSWNKIISFADLRYSEGDLYEKNGFTKDKVIGPDYRYVKNDKTFHKSNFTKENIKSKFNLTDEDINDKTEKQLMEELGFCRLYDIGKIKYVFVK